MGASRNLICTHGCTHDAPICTHGAHRINSSILRNEKYKGDALLQKTYTEDYLSKKVRKNRGEVKQYLVEHSHEPIIDPEIFDRVQEVLAKQRPYKAKLRDTSPLCNKLICADCGGFYGHKVWHNRSNTERYDLRSGGMNWLVR